MKKIKTKFAVIFGNRGFFPSSLQASARQEMLGVLKDNGHDVLVMDFNATAHGAVESPADGVKFANFLHENKGKFGGIILCLPNFGDETGAIAALKNADIPILIQAYPDELDKMAPALRRDAFCGKFSVMDVFKQYNLPFTALKPHVVHPQSKEFVKNLEYFDCLCRVYNGLKDTVVGAIGARTTAFKTVRIDELALQKHGITTETLDMSDIFARVSALNTDDKKVVSKAAQLKDISNWSGVPDKAFDSLSKLGVVLDNVIDEYSLDCLAIRCWIEMQQQLGVSPCVLLGLLNNKCFASACEVDIGNAITMHALSLATGKPSVCMDWNNNYGDDEDKCILFHCGSVAPSLMTCSGHVTGHAILENAVGKGCSFGCNQGTVKPMPFSYGSMLTENGKVCFYVGQGRITEDVIPADFFGCAGVAEIENLQDKLQQIGYLGHRHHVSLSPGHVMEPVIEAFEKYLGYDVIKL
jgi:L-fucose isomerase-like protein